MKNYRQILVISLVFMITSTISTKADQYQDNIVIILDASGSMNGNIGGVKKMDAAKSALREVLKKVPDTINIGLLVFSGSSITNDWVYPLRPRNDAELFEAINLPQPGGGTPLGKYIKKGADRLLKQRKKQYGYGSYRLLIVTDGEAQDQKLVDRYVPDVLSRGITTDVIGVGMKEEHILATMVHSYRRADDPESLKTAIAQVFAEISDKETDTAGEDAFDFLEGIPDGLAMEMIDALSSSGNYPIGEKPVVKAQSPKTEAKSDTETKAEVKKDTGSSSTWIIVVLVVVFLIIIISLRRRKTG